MCGESVPERGMRLFREVLGCSTLLVFVWLGIRFVAHSREARTDKAKIMMLAQRST